MRLVEATRLLTLIRDNPDCDYALVMGEFGCSRKTAREHVQRLVNSGEVDRKEGGPKGATLRIRKAGDGYCEGRPKCYHALITQPWTKDIDLEAA